MEETTQAIVSSTKMDDMDDSTLNPLLRSDETNIDTEGLSVGVNNNSNNLYFTLNKIEIYVPICSWFVLIFQQILVIVQCK